MKVRKRRLERRERHIERNTLMLCVSSANKPENHWPSHFHQLVLCVPDVQGARGGAGVTARPGVRRRAALRRGRPRAPRGHAGRGTTRPRRPLFGGLLRISVTYICSLSGLNRGNFRGALDVVLRATISTLLGLDDLYLARTRRSRPC